MQNSGVFLGFDANVQKSSSTLHRTFLHALECIENEINSCFSTSTPNLTPKQTVIEQRLSMSFTFSKHFEASAASLQCTDNDSGFVSNAHESSESLNNQSSSSQVENNSVYIISEDALLEKPNSIKKVAPNEDVYEEFSHLYYLNSIVPSSVQSPETDEHQSSEMSDVSTVVAIQSPIRVFKQDSQIIEVGKDKENVNPNCTIILPPNKTIEMDKSPNIPVKNAVDPNVSPELFSDGSETPTPTKLIVSATKPDRTDLTIDSNLVKRINRGLNGVLPPPSLTILQITAEEMLDKLKANAKLLDLSDCHSIQRNENLINTDLYTAQIMKWPQILELRYHGLHYNCTNLNADIETLSVKYGQRFVGAETESSCTVFDAHATLSSPAKRRLAAYRASGSASGARWTVKSPGRRLSHLARRRITFSSTTLKGEGSTAAVAIPSGSGTNRQILVDSKRFELLVRKRVSPRKKTPRKSPRKRIRTPSSSTKKFDCKVRRLNNAEDIGSFAAGLKATKRALFQSPDKTDIVMKQVKTCTSSSSNVSLSPWKRRPTPKQALFLSPDPHSNSSTCSSVFSTASDSRLLSSTSSSMFRRNLFASPTSSKSSNATQRQTIRNLFASPTRRSQRLDSSSSTASSVSTANDTELLKAVIMDTSTSCDGEEVKGSVWTRVKSEAALSCSGTSLSLHHKKKLQWAVYEALRSQQIGLNHPNFKQYAATLARVTRRFLPNLSAKAPRPEGGTSERMLRIARQHVFAVTKGRTVEEILQSKGVNNKS